VTFVTKGIVNRFAEQGPELPPCSGVQRGVDPDVQNVTPTAPNIKPHNMDVLLIGQDARDR
jgi:hypothetical protein